MDVSYLVVIALGVSFGLAELLSRYRDSPSALFVTPETYIYLLANGAIGAVALWLLEVFPVFEADGANGLTAEQIAVYNAMLAGFGGAAVLRSSVARTKMGDTEIAVGPAFVIETFLAVTDRAIDRSRARSRAHQITEAMRPVPLDFAAEALFAYCVGAMQNFSAAEYTVLRQRINEATTLSVGSQQTTAASHAHPSSIRSIAVGFRLTEALGAPLVLQAIRALAPEIQAAQEAQQAADTADWSNLERIITAGEDDEDTVAEPPAPAPETDGTAPAPGEDTPPSPGEETGTSDADPATETTAETARPDRPTG